ncbi:unnamed protein product [Onchocerca flexuosa]|uniref:Transposase n=1 Tax=Onchocerca flexuosa TaxID=387005 RepID=A0A183HUX5_9BILA|nr:unnamed protein product [Onchocerca flexuosa]
MKRTTYGKQQHNALTQQWVAWRKNWIYHFVVGYRNIPLSGQNLL